MMLFKNLAWRNREARPSSPLALSSVTAQGYAGFLSTVMVRGFAMCGCPSTLRKKRLAAAASRLAESRKSIVWPRLSTARYRYVQRPFTFTYVSSTRQEPLLGRRCGLIRFSTSGA